MSKQENIKAQQRMGEGWGRDGHSVVDHDPDTDRGKFRRRDAG